MLKNVNYMELKVYLKDLSFDRKAVKFQTKMAGQNNENTAFIHMDLGDVEFQISLEREVTGHLIPVSYFSLIGEQQKGSHQKFFQM